MHKSRLNEFRLYAILEPAGPVLIKSGMDSGADPSLPSMNFVRTRHPKSGAETIYLPGSSLKGALRAHCERIIRTVLGNDPEVCCDPLGSASCGRRIDDENKTLPKGKPLTTAEEYQRLCRACRIFGHTAHASHFQASDAYPETAINDLPSRQGVAINRFSGGVGVGPFELEVATQGQFDFHLALINFEIWQLGLLALALRDLAQGRLLIGFGKSRGLGQVSLQFTHLELAYPGRFTAGDLAQTCKGIGAMNKDLVSSYDLVEGDSSQLPSGARLAPGSVDWGRPSITFGFETPEAAWSADDTARQTAHAAIEKVLASFVPAWAKLQEASHA